MRPRRVVLGVVLIALVAWIVSGFFEPVTDEIGGQVARVEKSISTRGADHQGIREFTDPQCRRFRELEPGRTTTCTSLVIRDDGSKGRANFTVTLTECENTGQDTEFSNKSCEFRWEYDIAD